MSWNDPIPSPHRINTQIGVTYTLAADDSYEAGCAVTTCDNAATVAVMIPKNASVAIDVGQSFKVQRKGAGRVQFVPEDGTVTLNTPTGLYLSEQWGEATLRQIAPNVWTVGGDVSSLGFVTRWTVAGDEAARTISLPIAPTSNFRVDWGDGTIQYNVTSHTYALDGTYDVEITGSVDAWNPVIYPPSNAAALVAIVDWGGRDVFSGFGSLEDGFTGAVFTFLTSLPATGKILVRGAASMVRVFQSCASLAALPAGIFDDCVAVTDFTDACRAMGLTAIPSGLFDNCVSVTNFTQTFADCTSLAAIPSGLFDNCTLVTSYVGTFTGCSSLTAIPTGLFDNAVPSDLMSFASCFANCTSLASVPDDLFKYNVPANTFASVFLGCDALQVNPLTFYSAGEEGTRFDTGTDTDLSNAFYRDAFTGVQGTAPELWNCYYDEVINLDVAPATDWAVGDTITGQTSGATAVVVVKINNFSYRIWKHFHTGTDFQLGEVVGVTGVPAKLADQGASRPTFLRQPSSSGCFGGAGNSLASLTNYGSIPYNWIN